MKTFKNVMEMDKSHCDDEEKLYKEMEKSRKEEKIFEETCESFGIELTVIGNMKTSLETPIRYKGLVKSGEISHAWRTDWRPTSSYKRC